MSLEPVDTCKPFVIPKPPPFPDSAWLLEILTAEHPAITTSPSARKPPPWIPAVTFSRLRTELFVTCKRCWFGSLHPALAILNQKFSRLTSHRWQPHQMNETLHQAAGPWHFGCWRWTCWSKSSPWHRILLLNFQLSHSEWWALSRWTPSSPFQCQNLLHFWLQLDCWKSWLSNSQLSQPLQWHWNLLHTPAQSRSEGWQLSRWSPASARPYGGLRQISILKWKCWRLTSHRWQPHQMHKSLHHSAWPWHFECWRWTCWWWSCLWHRILLHNFQQSHSEWWVLSRWTLSSPCQCQNLLHFWLQLDCWKSWLSNSQLSQPLQGHRILLHDFRRSRSQGSQLSCWTLAGGFWLRSRLRFWWTSHSWMKIIELSWANQQSHKGQLREQINQKRRVFQQRVRGSHKNYMSMCTWELKLLWMSLLASFHTALQHGSEPTEYPTDMSTFPIARKPPPDFAETFSITTSESWRTFLGDRISSHWTGEHQRSFASTTALYANWEPERPIMFLAYAPREAPKMTYTCLSALTLLFCSLCDRQYLLQFPRFPWTKNDDASPSVIHDRFDVTRPVLLLSQPA